MGRGRSRWTSRSFARCWPPEGHRERLVLEGGTQLARTACVRSIGALTLGGIMSSFSTYIIGFIILIIGLALAAYLLNVPAMWIAVGVVVLIGIGVLMATSRTKPRDPPAV